MNLVVVFDTNILISASVSLAGAPFRCLSLAKAGDVESVTCTEILDEFREVLERKLRLPPETAALAVKEIQQFSRVVVIPGTLADVVVDPDDHKVLECAVVGGATHIVTGDKKHLLPLTQYQGIGIVTAVEFLQMASASK